VSFSDPRHRRHAHARGVRVRTVRAGVKAEVHALPAAAGCRRVAEILLAPPEELLGMPVARLLGAISPFAYSKITDLLGLAAVGCREPTIGSLTERQRRVIAGALRNPQALWPGSRLVRHMRELERP
jgi:hypothetical protein